MGLKAPPNKQLTMDIRKTKYTVNLHFKQETGETYKDKILKLIKKQTDNGREFCNEKEQKKSAFEKTL